MVASPVPTAGAGEAQRISLAEWLTLRRHPHPDFVRSLRELPSSLSTLIERELPLDKAIEGALVLPPEYRVRKFLGWEYVAERVLVFLDGGVLFALAGSPESAAQVTRLDARALLYARSSLILLYGLLVMKADCGAQTSEVRLEYNTVIWEALRAPVARFVAAACGPSSSSDEAQARAANEPVLKSLPFKFANGLRYYALVPGERLKAAIFQAAIWERRLILARQITPNTLIAFTDNKLVFIEESRASVWHKSSQGDYGWIFTYIPWDRVVDIVVTPSARLSELKVMLEWGAAKDERSFLLEPQTAAQLHRAWLDA